jgi:hypothetical protein
MGSREKLQGQAKKYYPSEGRCGDFLRLAKRTLAGFYSGVTIPLRLCF